MKNLIVYGADRSEVLVSTRLANHFMPTVHHVVEARDTFSRLGQHALRMTEGSSEFGWLKLRDEAQEVLETVAFCPCI